MGKIPPYTTDPSSRPTRGLAFGGRNYDLRQRGTAGRQEGRPAASRVTISSVCATHIDFDATSGREIVIAGGGVILLDDGCRVEAEDSKMIDATADAQAVTAAGSRLAGKGQVEADDRAYERE